MPDGVEEELHPMPDDPVDRDQQPQTAFEKVNDEAPQDAEPFVQPEPAPKNDEVSG